LHRKAVRDATYPHYPHPPFHPKTTLTNPSFAHILPRLSKATQKYPKLISEHLKAFSRTEYVINGYFIEKLHRKNGCLISLFKHLKKLNFMLCLLRRLAVDE
jgi:hypothetical protein